MRFRYELDGTGWATCTIEVAGQTATATASYLSDGLADLVAAVIAVCEGAAQASATFAEEPGAYGWHFQRVGGDRVRLQLREARGDSAPVEVILDGECRLRSFAELVRAELDRLLATHGETGYRELWVEHPFPVAAHRRLTRLLAE